MLIHLSLYSHFPIFAMYAINQTLEKSIIEADGRYLDTAELAPLEAYLQSYANRVNAYEHLREHSAKMVLQALQKMAQSNPEIIKTHGKRCQYDMSEVLRYTALSILRDDEVFFNEQMMSWLDTIILAYRRTHHCSTAYRYLQDIVNHTLPPAESDLIRPYLDSVISTLQSHA